MTILNIETSTTCCSAAITMDGTPVASVENLNQANHASELPRFIEQLLTTAKLNDWHLDAVALSQGPGSYTGLRIGASTAKGICYGLNIPLIPIDTLQVLCASVPADMLPQQAILCPMLDARRMEVYTANFNSKGEQLTPVEAKILDENSYAAELAAGPVLFTGNGAEKFKELVGNNPNACFAPQTPHATGMRAIASAKLEAGEFEDNAYFEPFYLKDFVAGKPKKLL